MALISLRGEGAWRGKATRAKSDRGQRFMRRLVNGYVSGDGEEIRSMPGFRTLVDLSVENNPTNGYRRLAIDTVFPVVGQESGTTYVYDNLSPSGAVRLTLSCAADETHIHGFEQIRGSLVLFGESAFRRVPIYTTSRATCAIASVAFANTASKEWVVVLDQLPGGYTNTDITAGMHGLKAGDIVWIDNVTVTASSPEVTQAMVDAALNGRFHRIKSIASFTLTLASSMSGAVASTGLDSVTGDIWRTRNNVSDTYPTPNSITPWEPNPYHRIDDPPCLTTWTIRDQLSLSTATTIKCAPAWVANRIRDWGDDNGTGADPFSPTLSTPHYDGLLLPGVSPLLGRSMSRRRQRSLPYRLNPDVAGDRILFAAPGYMCCFQAPMTIPIEPEAWPSPPSNWSPGGGRGLLWFANDIYDKPRSLGVPKAILVQSLVTSPAFSPAGTIQPSPARHPYNFLTTSSPGSALGGAWPSGTYKVAVSYVDEVTGDEGLASEPVTLPLSSGLGINLYIVHPGYVMSESMPRRVNVYVAPPGTDTLGFYTTLNLLHQPGSGTESLSAKYGLTAGVSPEVGRIWAVVKLPLLGSPLSDAIDFTKLAPQNGQQPRGAEAVRIIRGILFSVGHSGTHGNAGELLRSTMSADFSTASTSLTYGCFSPNQVQVRAWRSGMVEQSTPVSATPAMDGPFGIGSNFFPASYQGVEVFTRDLVPAPRNRFRIDRVLNIAALSENGGSEGSPFTTAAGRDLALRQRMSTVDDIRDRLGADDQQRKGREVFVVLPRGQVQHGDPGRPSAVTATSIQFMDAKKDDDGIAIGQVAGQAIICSKSETYLLAWSRTPSGNVPALVSEEIGCIASNSMVNFDGGLAWIDARGPVMSNGESVTRLGSLEHDFHGANTRYQTDSKGLMRHTWGAHDAARGLVYWGMVTGDSTHVVSYKGVSSTYANASDEARSRFPCNEILVWSYRNNAFSTWSMPSGMEVLWARPIKLGDGSTRMCILCADNRIYALDDEWADTNSVPFTTVAINNGSSSTSLTSAFTFGIDGSNGPVSRLDGTHIRAGMSVVFFRDGEFLASTTVASADDATSIITLTDACSWVIGDSVEIGHRPTMTIETAFVGSSEDQAKCNGIHLRYATEGSGKSHASCSVSVSDLSGTQSTAGMTESPRWQPLVGGTSLTTTDFDGIGQRRIFEEGFPIAHEVGITMNIMGRSSIRISDLLLEVTG